MSARDLALFQLDQARLPRLKPRLLRRRVGLAGDRRDHALAEKLYVGVVKNLLWLEALIEHHSGKRLDDIDPLVCKVLLIGLYQLRFLRVPAHAAVHEAVEQARRFGRARSAGFVNAVLRKATRQGDPAELPAHVVLSHPEPLLDRLTALLGAEKARALCRKHNEPPPVIVRLGAGVDACQLSESGVSVTPHAQAGLCVAEGVGIDLLADWARRGIAQVQDPTAAAVAEYCDVQPGHLILDRCCGVGTKTIQLWERSQPGGRVFAMDVNARRCQVLRQLLADRGIRSVGVVQGEWLAEAAPALPASFDRILVDAPCSNSGVLSRRAEARYAQSPAALASLAALQQKLLADSAGFVSAGGKLIYSTCSIWPEENERIVDAFVREFGAFEVIEQHVTYPSVDPEATRHHDGGFVAVMRRRG